MTEGFYLKFTTSYIPLIDIMKKYKAYLNEIMSKLSYPLFIEVIQQGYILIFESFEACRHHYNRKYGLSTLMQETSPDKNFMKMYKGFENFDAFPIEGIEINLQTEPRYLNKIFILLSQKYKMVDDRIGLTLIPREKVVIHFSTKNSFLHFIGVTTNFSEQIELQRID